MALNKPNAILTADWHLREDKPVCRTDDFWATQWEKVAFIKDVQRAYDCPVLHAGDLFNHWKPSPNLLSYAIANLPAKFYTVYGQHDLPQHSMKFSINSGLRTLEVGGVVRVLSGVHYGHLPEDCDDKHMVDGYKVLVWHRLVQSGEKLWPDAPDLRASEILKQYDEYRLIVTGDNHKSFVTKMSGRLLVNPGSLTRQTADQAEHKPCVYLWYAKDNLVQPKYVPLKCEVVTREHLDTKAVRDRRIAAFMQQLSGDWNVNVSFEDNLGQFELKNHVHKLVMAVIRKAMEI